MMRFRVGEYIQSGSYKGTVESFSLRSVRLRPSEAGGGNVHRRIADDHLPTLDGTRGARAGDKGRRNPSTGRPPANNP